MIPRRKLIEKCKAEGGIDRLNQLLSAAHLLQCVASNLYGEAEDLMRSYGLHLGDIKKAHTSLVKASNNYFQLFASLVESDEHKQDMFADMEAYEKGFREWAKIPLGWKPNK